MKVKCIKDCMCDKGFIYFAREREYEVKNFHQVEDFTPKLDFNTYLIDEHDQFHQLGEWHQHFQIVKELTGEIKPPISFKKINSGLTDYQGDIIKSVIQTKIDDQIRILDKKKEELLRQKLIDLGIDINELNQKRRFPLITSEIEESGKETIYYNDGSKYGKRVITFYPLQIDDSGNRETNSFSLSFQYR